MTGVERQLAEALDDLAHGVAPEAILRELVEEAEERGREEVRVYARRVRDDALVRLAEYRRDAIANLDPSTPASLAVEYTVRAATTSAVVVHLSGVAEWRPL